MENMYGRLKSAVAGAAAISFSAATLFAAAAHPALAETTLHVMSWQPAYVAGRYIRTGFPHRNACRAATWF